MTARSALARGRAAHAALYVDTCTITRVTGQTLGADNVMVDATETIYSGVCRLKSPTTGANATQVAEQSMIVRRYYLDLPWDAAGPVLTDDVVTITASDDTWALTTPLTVIDAGLSGSTTTRRLVVEARQ